MILKGEHGQVKITSLFRNQSNTNDFWDSNWLTCQIQINTPGFTASYNSNLRTNEFRDFLSQIAQLERNEVSVAIFSTMEGWLDVRIEKNNTYGNFHCMVVATAIDFNGSSLNFKMDMDYGNLKYLMDSLQELLNEYPVLFLE